MNEKNGFVEAAQAYRRGRSEIVRGVLYARAVILDTLHKFPTDAHPKELEWATKGIDYLNFEFSHPHGEIIFDADPLEEGNSITVTIREKNRMTGETKLFVATFPALLIKEDPTAISSYARELIRREQRKSVEEREALDQAIARVEVEAERLEARKQQLIARRAELL